jgi:putative ABC transport system substrate-binding protein
MYGTTSFATTGGLLTYSPNTDENFRRAASFVDRILKGANPGDLPVELPTRYEFVINLKTAQALGITISDEVLAQATQVIR